MQNKRTPIPTTTRQKVYEKYNGCSAYCGISLEYKDMQVDHLHPVQKGGSNELENLMPACRSCNHYKESFTLEQFRERMSKTLETFRTSPLARLSARYGTAFIYAPWNKHFYFETQP